MTADHRPHPNVHAGQKVITSAGTTRIVAFVDPRGVAFVYGATGALEPAHIVCDAWGGEAALTDGLPGPQSGDFYRQAA